MRGPHGGIRVFRWIGALAAMGLCALAPGTLASQSDAAFIDELGSQLRPLRGGNDEAIATARQTDLTVSRAERVMVDIYVSGSADASVDRLREAGMSVTATADSPLPVVEGWLPVTSLGETAGLSVTDAVLPVIGGGTDAGAAQSQGVAAHRIPQANAAGVGTGAGVDVGVISDSIDRIGGGVSDSQGTGDLPANVLVLKDDTGTGVVDEGRAMAEIIYDEAPGLNKILFASGTFGGPVGKADSINQLVANGVDVIADDIFQLSEPFFQDGQVAQAVDNARAAGIPYFSSAGNRARQSYEGTYADSVGFHDFDPGAGVDTVQTLASVPNNGFIQVALDWDEPWGSAETDLNALLRTALDGALTGSAVSGGTDANLTTGLPREIVTWSNTTGGTVSVGLKIQRVAGTRSPFMKHIARGSFGVFTIGQFATNSDTINPDAASAKGAITVAAVNAGDPGLDTPESFSSRGPKTRLFDAAGVRLSSPEVRVKPELAAADGVSTTVPAFPTFFGTSAATPSAAGIAVMLRSTNPNATVSEIRAQVTDTLNAVDCTSSPLVPDPDCGAGFIFADSAFAGLDKTGPTVTAVRSPSSPNGKNGWYTKTVGITWSVTDAQSPVESAPCPAASDKTDGIRTFNCTGSISGGGPATGTVQIKRDTVKPSLPKIKRFNPRQLPPRGKIKCKSKDKTSGLASCKITGYSKKPGKHKLVATATDKAGLKSVRKLKYTVAKH